MTVQQRAGALASEAAARFRKLEPGTRSRLLAAVALVAGLHWGPWSGMQREPTGGLSMRVSIRTMRARSRSS